MKSMKRVEHVLGGRKKDSLLKTLVVMTTHKHWYKNWAGVNSATLE